MSLRSPPEWARAAPKYAQAPERHVELQSVRIVQATIVQVDVVVNSCIDSVYHRAFSIFRRREATRYEFVFRSCIGTEK